MNCKFVFIKYGPEYIFRVLDFYFYFVLVAIYFSCVFFEIFCTFGIFCAGSWGPPSVMLLLGSPIFHGG